MAKQTGLGHSFWVGGNDISGDTQQVKSANPIQTLDGTDITQSANARLFGHRDGNMDFTVFMDPTGAHPVLSALPTSDTLMTWALGSVLGNPAACLVAKQINYDPTRGTDGSLLIAVHGDANGYGTEWGVQLTAGLRTDTAATNGTSLDQGAATNFGAQAYLQCTAFTGTDVTVHVQDSADNVTFTDVTGLVFAATTAAQTWQRLATANNATIRRYVRVATTTSGGFTSATFAVVLNRNPIAGVAF
jgi:hypothetical protein